MITLHEVSNDLEMKHFVLFPFSLYKKNKFWVPPIIKEEVDNFNPKKNPVFKKLFFIYKMSKSIII